MNSATLTGPSAELRWSYRQAATLGPWRLEFRSLEGTLTATVRELDAFAVSQRPLTLVVPREKGPDWCWPITALQIADDHLTATVSAQE